MQAMQTSSHVELTHFMFRFFIIVMYTKVPSANFVLYSTETAVDINY